MNGSLTNLLILALFSIPFISVMIAVLFKVHDFKPFLLVEMGVFMTGLFGLMMFGEQEVITSLTFMEAPITFSISFKAVLLFSMTLLVLLVMLWLYTPQKEPDFLLYQFILLSVAISFGFIAFISGQFMVRYIALDIVGLLAALSVLVSFSESKSFKDFIFIFQILRLGDLALLASILLLNQFSGTLDIAQMIASTQDMPLNMQTWVFGGFLFAILIKLAIWPFGVWLNRVKRSEAGISFWISGFLMPSLGYYLLYRILPIIGLNSFFQHLILILAIATFFFILIIEYLRLLKFDRFKYLNAISGCFLLMGVVITNNQMLLYFLLGLIFYRLVLYVDQESDAIDIRSAIVFLPLILNGSFLWLNINDFSTLSLLGWILLTALWVLGDVMITRREKISIKVLGKQIQPQPDRDIGGDLLYRFASWLNQILEVGVLTKGIQKFSTFFSEFAVWVHENIEQRLENLWSSMGNKLMEISEGTLSILEVEAAEKTDHLVDTALDSLEGYEDSVLRKALRWDLLWIPLLLVVILILLVVV